MLDISLGEPEKICLKVTTLTKELMHLTEWRDGEMFATKTTHSMPPRAYHMSLVLIGQKLWLQLSTGVPLAVPLTEVFKWAHRQNESIRASVVCYDPDHDEL